MFRDRGSHFDIFSGCTLLTVTASTITYILLWWRTIVCPRSLDPILMVANPIY